MISTQLAQIDLKPLGSVATLALTEALGHSGVQLLLCLLARTVLILASKPSIKPTSRNIQGADQNFKAVLTPVLLHEPKAFYFWFEAK